MPLMAEPYRIAFPQHWAAETWGTAIFTSCIARLSSESGSWEWENKTIIGLSPSTQYRAVAAQSSEKWDLPLVSELAGIVFWLQGSLWKGVQPVSYQIKSYLLLLLLLLSFQRACWVNASSFIVSQSAGQPPKITNDCHC